MQVKVAIEVSLDTLKEYMDEYYECNGERLTIEQAKQSYIDQFIADKNDYIDPVKIQVYFVQEVRMSDNRIVFSEPKEVVLTPAPAKRSIFKLKTYVMSDKYDAMKEIRKKDPTAEFKITGDWSLRVRTNLTYNELMVIMMETESFIRLKPAWFF